MPPLLLQEVRGEVEVERSGGERWSWSSSDEKITSLTSHLTSLISTEAARGGPGAAEQQEIPVRGIFQGRLD